MAHLTLTYLSDYKNKIGKEEAQKYTHDTVNSNTGSLSACLYRASMTIKTLYYPTDAQIYNS